MTANDDVEEAAVDTLTQGQVLAGRDPLRGPGRTKKHAPGANAESSRRPYQAGPDAGPSAMNKSGAESRSATVFSAVVAAGKRG